MNRVTCGKFKAKGKGREDDIPLGFESPLVKKDRLKNCRIDAKM